MLELPKSIEQRTLDALLNIDAKLGEIAAILAKGGTARTHTTYDTATDTLQVDVLDAAMMQKEAPRVPPRKRR